MNDSQTKTCENRDLGFGSHLIPQVDIAMAQNTHRITTIQKKTWIHKKVCSLGAT